MATRKRGAKPVNTFEDIRTRQDFLARDHQRTVAQARARRSGRSAGAQGGRRRGTRRGDAGQPDQGRRVRRARTQTTARACRSSREDVAVTGSTLSENESVAEAGLGRPDRRIQPHQRSARSRARGCRRPRAHHQPGRAGRRQPELAEGRPARTRAARRFHPAREDHALRSRAHSRAHRARARFRRARLLRVLRTADEDHARVAVLRSRQAHAGVRALLDRGRRARLDRHGARRARLRGEVLHRRRQLGSGRQQHPGVLHPGRDEVSRPHPRREAGAAPRHAAGGERARHVLGFRVADARVRAHADVGDVGPRHPAQLSHDAGLRRAHVPHGQ